MKPSSEVAKAKRKMLRACEDRLMIENGFSRQQVKALAKTMRDVLLKENIQERKRQQSV